MTLVERLKALAAGYRQQYNKQKAVYGPGGAHFRKKIKTCEEAAAEIERLEAENARLRDALVSVDAECTCAIAYEELPAIYDYLDDIPNGLRTVAHIKLAMVRGYARAALEEKQ